MPNIREGLVTRRCEPRRFGTDALQMTDVQLERENASSAASAFQSAPFGVLYPSYRPLTLFFLFYGNLSETPALVSRRSGKTSFENH
jgi:hypothetical protein